MNKKTTAIVAISAIMCAGSVFARGHGGPHGGFGRGPAPAIHHHHGGSAWGRGGRNFWPGFVGGVVGGVLSGGIHRPPPPPRYYYSTPVVTPAPVVVTTPVVAAPVVATPVVTTPVVTPAPVVAPAPVYQTQNVWVEGRYVDQVQANGTTVRVWQPGHYEQRQVLVQ